MSTTKFSADHDQSQQHHAILDHQRVAIGDRLQHQAAESGQHEHVLDHDRAGDQIGELQPHDGEDRRQRVRQRMAPERGAARDALGARGAHEVLVQGLDQRRPGDAGHDRGLHDAKRDRRKDQRAERPRRVAPSREIRRPERASASRRTPARAESRARSSAPRCRSGSAPITIASPARPRRSAA